MYKWWHKDPHVEQVWDHIEAAGGKDGISVLQNTLEEVMMGKLLSSIEASWDKDGISAGKLGVCAQKCGAEFDPFGEQFK
jgi:hypothetical protein